MSGNRISTSKILKGFEEKYLSSAIDSKLDFHHKKGLSMQKNFKEKLPIQHMFSMKCFLIIIGLRLYSIILRIIGNQFVRIILE